jgi:hypothetical protein
MQAIDGTLTIPTEKLEEVQAYLSSEPRLQFDYIPSTGAEGGGNLGVIVLSLAKETIGRIREVLYALNGYSSIKLVIGSTVLEGKALRNPDLGSLLDKVLEIEIARSSRQRKK